MLLDGDGRSTRNEKKNFLHVVLGHDNAGRRILGAFRKAANSEAGGAEHHPALTAGVVLVAKGDPIRSSQRNFIGHFRLRRGGDARGLQLQRSILLEELALIQKSDSASLTVDHYADV